MNNSNHFVCDPNGIPMPIVILNRTVIVGGVVLALWANQPLIIAGLFALLLPAALFGRRASPIFALGARLFANKIQQAEVEDAKIQRFNNIIATTMLGAALMAFVENYNGIGWALAVAVSIAALVALAGFCVGCFIYFQFKLNRYRVLNWLGR